MHTGSLSKSAAELNISQPTASGVLQRLESSVGIKLFDRVNFGLVPTREAVQLLPEVERIFSHLEHLEVKVKNIAGGGSAFLSIQSIPSMYKYFITPTLKVFHKVCPSVRMSIHSAQSSQVLSNIEVGAFDVGFVYGTQNKMSLEYIPLEKIFFACVMRHDNPLAEKSVIDIEDLMDHNLILNRPGTDLRLSVDEALYRHGMTVRPIIEAGTIQAYDFIANGLGVGILDSALISGSTYPELVYRPLSIEIEVQACMIYNKFTPLSSSARQYIDIVQSVFLDDHKLDRKLFSKKVLDILDALIIEQRAHDPL